MLINLRLCVAATIVFLLAWVHPKLAAAQYCLNINYENGMQDFFTYTGKDIPIVSGHRGTLIKGFPENSVEGFEHVLQFTPAFFEIDPRLTKDSVVVLMHDATLDRTTTGTGKISDHTWSQLQQLFLKDAEGNVTPYKIPTLASVIEWARNKTILNLDKKDVPLETVAKMIRELNATNFVMVTVHNAEQASFYYKNNSSQMMSAFVKTAAEMQAYESAAIPWKNMIAYIGSQNRPENKIMLDLLHARKVMCMISAAPVYDKLPNTIERAAAYQSIFSSGADILESDLPIEVAKVVKMPANSRKLNFICVGSGTGNKKRN